MLVLFMLCPLYAIAESDAPLLAEDGWSYIGYSYGGITFAVPADFVNYDLSASDTANGYILIGGNDEFVLQMRVFQADELTYDEFKAMVEKTPSAESSVRVDGDSEILTYRNTQPSASNELYGIAMTGFCFIRSASLRARTRRTVKTLPFGKSPKPSVKPRDIRIFPIGISKERLGVI
mgnify:CR=1 FL=1